jgi:hypothetical protein
VDQLSVAVVSGQQVAALRAALAFDPAQAQEWRARLTGSGDLDGFSELIYAGFVVAVRRYFGTGWSRGDVVRYVGTVRAHGPAGDDIDPSVAEALILRALGADQPLDASLEAKVEVQTVLLGVLAADLELDDAGLHLFVGQARELADGWLAERG